MISFDDLQTRSDHYATEVVDRLLRHAIDRGASDVHIEKSPQGLLFRIRVNGSLIDAGHCKEGDTTSILGRLKALARLISYRSDLPQEGRLVVPGTNVEARVGTLPTLHGERAVVRLANREYDDWLPHQLGLSEIAVQRLQETLDAPSGVLLITGPAGSGKTTTAYACLRYLLNQTNNIRSIVSLEDPIESELSGVCQSQINPAGGYSWADGLRALLRQDLEVMLIGEIRDPETAAVVFQAAMTGQLVISTMHARSAADAIRRLMDMQLPMHHLRSGLDHLSCQRLVKELCTKCCTGEEATENCEACGGSGYAGRLLLAEELPRIEGDLARAILEDSGSGEIEQAAKSLGMKTLLEQAAHGVEQGRISSLDAERLRRK